MNFLVLLLICGMILTIAYFTYGKFIENKLEIDPARKTPAVEMSDGVDYVATKKPVLLGHHFATIAGGGPIVGPITAVVFGWLPAVLWILFGSIFMGGVHDYTSLQASIRHRGQSIGAIIKEYIGRRGQTLFLIFSIATLILIVGVFIILVADTFSAVPEAATASVLFILLAPIFGVMVNQMRINLFVASIFGIIAMFLSIYIGMLFPIQLDSAVWSIILIIYAYVASVLPVWVLLQPRDYLNSFLLYGMIIGATIGVILFAPEIKFPAYVSFYNENLGYLFPILFITIACGALSGFHSLVSSGTTAKQLDNEKSGRFITYGGMLIEAFLAVIAIGSVIYLSQAEFTARLAELKTPVGMFSAGIGEFMSAFGLPIEIGTSFVALTVSAFLLTSLDSATRLGRYAVQEFCEERAPKIAKNAHASTFIIVAFAAILALSGTWSTVWPIFGAANQMLGALALLAVTAWLAKRKTKTTFTAIPMVIMFVITLSALIVIMQQNFIKGNYILVVIAIALFILCIALVIEAWQTFTRTKSTDKTIKA
ncbi:carbon starvation CstA family protein [Aeribacillus alveayuensis]|uniref:Carbon starvation protein n=1 Tax=Aeribacillus alveayuensis TaxID=279215 RepID=A0ABT9VQ64_9BACI|nr:carbon starvation protein [Bacillus alveayuensis]